MIDIARKAAAAPDLPGPGQRRTLQGCPGRLKPGAAKSKTEAWTSGERREDWPSVSNAQRVVVTVDRKQSPGFADFLLTKRERPLREFEKSGAGKGDT